MSEVKKRGKIVRPSIKLVDKAKTGKKKVVPVRLAAVKKSETGEKVLDLDALDGVNTDEFFEKEKEKEETVITVDNAQTVEEILDIVKDDKDIVLILLEQYPDVKIKKNFGIKRLVKLYLEAKKAKEENE